MGFLVSILYIWLLSINLLLTPADTWNEDNSTNPSDSESEILEMPGAL